MLATNNNSNNNNRLATKLKDLGLHYLTSRQADSRWSGWADTPHPPSFLTSERPRAVFWVPKHEFLTPAVLLMAQLWWADQSEDTTTS